MYICDVLDTITVSLGQQNLIHGSQSLVLENMLIVEKRMLLSTTIKNLKNSEY